MLVELSGHACALCRISVAELRRLTPSAFSLLMVVSLLLADGLLPVLAVKYRTEAALYSNSITARSNTFIGGEWGGAHAMAGGGTGRTQGSHKRTRVKPYWLTPAGGADGKGRHHLAGASRVDTAPLSNTSSSSTTRVAPSPLPLLSPLHRHANVSSNNTNSTRHPDISSANVSNETFCVKDEYQSFQCTSCGARDKCLVLNNVTVQEFCADPERGSVLEMRLGFCSSFTASSVYDNTTANCTEYMLGVLEKDDEAREMFSKFYNLISRFDCDNVNYSAKWDCQHCQIAYRDWLCSNNLKYFHSGLSWPPCSQFCESVEERCPFFRPEVRTQAGDPSFICKDHHMNLPRTYTDTNCYRPCHLWWGTSELQDDYCHSRRWPNSTCSLLTDCESPDATFAPAAAAASLLLLHHHHHGSDSDGPPPRLNVTGGERNGTAPSSGGAALVGARTSSVDLYRVVLTLCLTLAQFRYLITELT